MPNKSEEDRQPLTPEQQKLVVDNKAFGIFYLDKLIATNGCYKRADRDDLISAAHLGMVIAAQRFDASQGKSYLTYAGWWIRKCVQDAACAAGAITAPREIFRDRSGLLETTAHQVNCSIHCLGSNDAELDKVPEFPESEPAKDHLKTRQEIEEIMRILPPTYKEIVKKVALEGYSQRELANEMKVTVQNVNNIFNRSIRKMQKHVGRTPAKRQKKYFKI